MMSLAPYPVMNAFPHPAFRARGHRLAQAPQPQGDPAQQLLENGAIVQVQLTVPAEYAAAGGKANPRTVRAMVDTGASISAIYNPEAESVGLQAVGSTKIGGVGGVTDVPIYAASMTLPEYNVTVDPIQIAGVLHPLPNVEMLIGRDLLRKLRLDYRGVEGAFSLHEEAPGTAPPPQVPLSQGYKGPPPPAPTPGQAPPGQGLPQPPPAGTSTGTYLAIGGGAAAALAAAGFIFKVF